jgi:hypothetical protein
VGKAEKLNDSFSQFGLIANGATSKRKSNQRKLKLSQGLL